MRYPVHSRRKVCPHPKIKFSWSRTLSNRTCHIDLSLSLNCILHSIIFSRVFCSSITLPMQNQCTHLTLSFIFIYFLVFQDWIKPVSFLVEFPGMDPRQVIENIFSSVWHYICPSASSMFFLSTTEPAICFRMRFDCMYFSNIIIKFIPGIPLTC